MTTRTGERDVVIYGLVDPRTNELRYVGKTSLELSRRLRNHICRTNLYPVRHSSRWIAGVVAGGNKPEIFEIELIKAGGDWSEAERFWIEYFRFIGCRLTNLTDGGEGLSGYVFPESRKNYLSEKFKGREFDAEWKRKIAVSKKGTRPLRSPEIEARRIRSLKASLNKRMSERTHCRNGHELIGENVVVSKRGIACRICQRVVKRRGHLNRKARNSPNRKPPMSRTERSEHYKKVFSNPAIRKKMSDAARRRSENPEWRKRHSLLLTGRAMPKTRGELNHNAKFTWVEVAEIRRRCAAGESRKKVGAEFGVCAAVVDRIVWNKTWKVVPD